MREREAQHEAAFEATMAAGREPHEKGKVAEDAVVAELLMESLGKPNPRKERNHPRRRPRRRRPKF
jgi:hypothetical protein